MPSPVLTVDMFLSHRGQTFVTPTNSDRVATLCATAMRRMFDMRNVKRNDEVTVKLYDRKVPKGCPITLRYSRIQRYYCGYYWDTGVRWTTGKGKARSYVFPDVKTLLIDTLFKNAKYNTDKKVWLVVVHNRKKLDPRK